ncbi:MAG: dihydrofolate reductase [Ignavibacteria bacterium]|nr:dihydrofolate reductase [Ignavibacteria bacterium]
MIISMIAAVARNYTIGAGNSLPWEMPTDMHFFMKTTRGHHVIMGRKSFEDIGKPLQGRTNIVVTRQASYQANGVCIAHSLDEALALARQNGETEVFIIGGENLFTEGLQKADKIYLTWIHADFEGDTHFPRFDPKQWHEIERTDCASDAENPYPYSFTTLAKAH